MLVCKNWLFKALYLRWVFTTDGLIPLMITVSCASLILNSAELTASELPEQYWMYCNGVCNLDEKVADESCVEKRASKIHGTYLGHVFLSLGQYWFHLKLYLVFLFIWIGKIICLRTLFIIIFSMNKTATYLQ